MHSNATELSQAYKYLVCACRKENDHTGAWLYYVLLIVDRFSASREKTSMKHNYLFTLTGFPRRCLKAGTGISNIPHDGYINEIVCIRGDEKVQIIRCSSSKSK